MLKSIVRNYEIEFEKERITKDYIEKHPEIITKYLDDHP